MFYAVFSDGAIVFLGKEKEDATEVLLACAEQNGTELHAGIRTLNELSLKYDAYLILASADETEESVAEEEEQDEERRILEAIEEFMVDNGLTRDNLNRMLDKTTSFVGRVFDKSKAATKEAWGKLQEALRKQEE